MSGSREGNYGLWRGEGVEGGLAQCVVLLLVDDSWPQRSLSLVRLLFGKPFLAFLQILIKQHRQVPDHERQHDLGKELGRVSKFRFQRDPQFWWECSVGGGYRCRGYRLRVLIQ